MSVVRILSVLQSPCEKRCKREGRSRVPPCSSGESGTGTPAQAAGADGIRGAAVIRGSREAVSEEAEAVGVVMAEAVALLWMCAGSVITLAVLGRVLYVVAYLWVLATLAVVLLLENMRLMGEIRTRRGNL